MKYLITLSVILFFSVCNLNASSNLIVPNDMINNCNTSVDTLPELFANCPFSENNNSDGFIDNDEYEIMQFCLSNRIKTIEELASSIIGEWELVGHGEGWFPSVSQPCGNIVFSDTNLIVEFKDEFLDTMTTHSWTIIDGEYPSLELTPPNYYGSGLDNISNEYMFSDDTPLDGNMYMYQKKKATNNVELVVDESNKPMSIFPNPTYGIFTLELFDNSKKVNSINVYNLIGSPMPFEHFYGDGLISIDLTGNNSGTYYLVIDVGGDLYNQKVIIF